jgi:hypothetical protein
VALLRSFAFARGIPRLTGEIAVFQIDHKARRSESPEWVINAPVDFSFGRCRLGFHLRHCGETRMTTASTSWRGEACRICGEPGDALPRQATRKPAMEVAAIVLFSSVVLWFFEEAADEHV